MALNKTKLLKYQIAVQVIIVKTAVRQLVAKFRALCIISNKVFGGFQKPEIFLQHWPN